MPEVISLEPKHLTGKDGNGKGSQRRRGSSLKAYEAGWEQWFGKKESGGPQHPAGNRGVPADHR